MKSRESEREKKLEVGVPRGFIYVFAGGEGEVGTRMMMVMTMARGKEGESNPIQSITYRFIIVFVFGTLPLLVRFQCILVFPFNPLSQEY